MSDAKPKPSTIKRSSKYPARVVRSRAQPPARTHRRAAARSRARVAKNVPPPENIPQTNTADPKPPVDLSEKKRLFLTALFDCKKHVPALSVSGLKWEEVSDFLCANGAHYDAEFTTCYQKARRVIDEWRHICRMEEAERRAVEGWDEPVFYEGVQVSVIRRYSDTLMLAMLKAGDPGRFGTERHQHSGPNGEAIPLAMTSMPPEFATPEEWEKHYRTMMSSKGKSTDSGGKS